MRLRFVWPGRTRSPELRALEREYAARIRKLVPCEIIVTREGRGVPETLAERVKEIEAQGLEKHLAGATVVCLEDRGKEMTSDEFAAFLRARERATGRPLAFVVGGFLGLAGRIAERSEMRLSLSRMTMSHELARVVLLEQVYRALTLVRGLPYAK